MMTISGAIFDMDGTLIDSLWGWNEFWDFSGQRFLGVDHYRPDPTLDKTLRTMLLGDAMDRVHELLGFGESGGELLAHFHAILPELYRSKFQLKPGAREFLDHLRAQGVRICLASATDLRFVRIALEANDISGYFQDVLSCADIGKGKEYPDIYEEALQRLGTARDETWVFEDSVVALRTAASIGLRTVGIYDAYNYDQEGLSASADAYIAEGETLMKLVSR